ncbi:MAG: ABC transporter substrate-binding protein [Desulfobacterales bacterium]|nr:MAG: ABC transporter substrate-binding protein [Desulfobacterales bacterium]
MRKIWFSLVLAMSLAPVMALCAEQPVTGGTLIWGRGGDSVILDLAQATDGESIKAGIQIFENLVIFGKDSMDIEPQLAESWTVSEDGLTWTFKLRQGVTFHDGTPFNAQAVYDSFARVIDENHPFYGYGKWKYLSLSLGQVSEIKVIDDYTVALVTPKPYAPLLNNLALWLCPILSPQALAEHKDQIGLHPVGTGPFKFVKWVKDDQIILERNEDYWGEKAKVDKIILKSIPEPSARLMALQSGTVDIADDLDPDSISLVKKDDRLAVTERPSVNVGYLALNTQKPALKDVRVRRAINHAIDKETLIKTIFQGLAVPAKNPFAPSIWGYNDAITPYAYDPEQARKLLAEAGFDHNAELELWAMPVSRAYMPEPVKTAELIQAYLAAVGLKAKIVRHDWGTYLSKTANGEHDMCMLGWLGGNADPDNFLYGLLSADTAQTPGAANVALWKNATFTELCLQAQKTFDKTERTQLYLKAQEIFHDEAPWVPLAHSTIVRCYNKRLHDVPLRPNGLNSFQMVWKEK